MKKPTLSNNNHILFCEKYVETLDPIRSYMEVYPKSTEDWADKKSQTLLNNPEVQEYLKHLLKGEPVLKNQKHMLFILRYLETLDPVNSYMYVYPGTTRQSAYSSAYRILNNPDNIEYMNYYIRQGIKANNKLAISLVGDTSKVIRELFRLALSDDFNYAPTKLTATTTILNALGFLDPGVLEEKLIQMILEQEDRGILEDKVNSELANQVDKEKSTEKAKLEDNKVD